MAKQYRLVLLLDDGYDGGFDLVAHRTFRLGFDGIGHNGTWSSDEEYMVARKAREMFRDAAHAAGKWPTKKGNA